MEFLDISSLGATYRYVVKIEQKFKQKNKHDFSSANPSQKSMVKVALTPKEKDRARMASPRTTSPSHKKRRVMGSRRRTLESGVSSTKSLGTTLMNVTPNNHCWLR
jgi:hypothetical protein